MTLSVELDRNDLFGLERVAEGRAASLPETTADRLLALGLVQKGEAASLQLTSAGLSLIHSSDQ
ncbi:hypothetical protein [Dyella acidiphila]|uniref:Uncharacterized protein n=1 Tax=Dyella acidiphila TaxID=2775866 RepID=A0ABR9GEG6_9GAMM|nr:hypothetical protein [Dyella acidiphila]MBE1162428.1 hypothetical protein [Dyella acidiphila]